MKQKVTSKINKIYIYSSFDILCVSSIKLYYHKYCSEFFLEKEEEIIKLWPIENAKIINGLKITLRKVKKEIEDSPSIHYVGNKIKRNYSKEKKDKIVGTTEKCRHTEKWLPMPRYCFFDSKKAHVNSRYG